MIRNNIYFRNRDIEFSISLVTEHEIQNKLPIVIYRCPKTAATPGLYHSYEPKIDLASDVPIETRETPEIPTVISNREISTWDKNPKLNQTKLIGRGIIRLNKIYLHVISRSEC